MSKIITYLHVRAINACSSQGRLIFGHTHFPCLLGKTGMRFRKHEGDGASPIGSWQLENLYYRPDKMLRPLSGLNTKPMSEVDGWCDAQGNFAYNRAVKLPFHASHERLWRNDNAYDLVVTTNHNQRPRIRGFGSAIFFHAIGKNAKSTEGCIALREKHLRFILNNCSRKTLLIIWPPNGSPPVRQKSPIRHGRN